MQVPNNMGPTLLLLLCPFLSSAQTSDVAPPTLVSLTISPTTIDVRNGAQTVVIRARITDDLSGFNPSASNFLRHSSGRSAWCGWNWTPASGNTIDGVWECTARFAQYSASGTWTFEPFITDLVGNHRTYSSIDLHAAGFPSTVTVISNPDLTAPTLTSLDVVPNVIDVSAADQSEFVKLGVNDMPSGVEQVLVSISSPGGEQQWNPIASFAPIEGTRANGIWQAKFLLPRHSAAGPWFVKSVTLWDNARNAVALNRAQLEAAGFTPTFAVNSATPDLAPPTLLGYSYSPTFINTALSAQQVSMQLRLQDNLSGLTFDETGGGATAMFISPSGRCCASAGRTYVGSAPYNSGRLLAGTTQSGTWGMSIYFGRFVESGTWKLYWAVFRDRVNNVRTYDQAQLQALGLSTTVEVIFPTGSVDGSAGVTGGTVQDQAFGARAQLIFPPGALPRATQVSIDVLAAPVNVPNPQGFSTPETPFVNIDLSPHPVGMFPPPGVTLTIPLKQTLPPGTVLTLLRINPGSATLVPATHVNGGLVTGTVTVDGLNATFTGIAALSTVVAMRQAASVAGDVNGDGVVNCADIAIIKTSYGKRTGDPGFELRADVTGDGIVNLNDLSYVTRRLPAGLRCL